MSTASGSAFAHLHVHSEFSLLDGLCHVPALAERVRELGMEAVALTDHGALYGVVPFYKAARDAGVKPIVGCELYVAGGDMTSRTAADRNAAHLVVLAKNRVGYRNLIELVSRAHLDGFYYKPRVDRALLAAHSSGLIALSACMHGEVPRLLLGGRRDEAAATVNWYRDTFDDFYLEVQQHGIAELPALNVALVALARELGVPLVATNDVHYLSSGDAYAHDILLCIQTNTTIYDEKRLRMADDSFYLRSPTEMAALFADLPDAIANTQRIADACDLTIDFDRLHLPQAEVPPGETADAYLERLCFEGLRRLYGAPSAEVEARLRYELDVIRQTNYADYFLVVRDFVNFAKQRGIFYGVRGSAAASLVLYSLGVTDIDPLTHTLVFERFLNPERKEMPDIDLDFADDRRDEVIAYVTQKYGAEHVAQIITFGTLGAKAAVRDVGRALGMPYADVDRVARLIPPTLNIALARALEQSIELRELHDADETIRHLLETAQQLEGTIRNAGTHAAGVVIASEPLVEHVPLQRPSRGSVGAAGTAMTQFDMDSVAAIGLLKMDFLGLANLTILSRACDLIAKHRGIELDLSRLPLDDAATFAMLGSGETTGIFQLESAGMRRYIQELRPTTFSDVSAMVALYRPGPMQHIDTFIRAKHGLAEVRYPHPALADILRETYGVIVYQDQVLHIARRFAGYSLGQADVVRKAMGKKIPEVMREERSRFVAGAIAQDFSAALAFQIFDLIEPFAGYAFNKAHSVSYALLAYQTAYLKAHYSGEFMTALLSVHTGQPDKIAAGVAECRRLGIAVLPPDINESELDFTLATGPTIRFGLGAIKNVSSATLTPILEERARGGPFASLDDFCRRAPLRGATKRVLESLIKAGAFDRFGRRGAILAALDRIVAVAQREQQRRDSGQTAMFDLWGETVATPFPKLQLISEDVSITERLAWERELLGVYMSEHPFHRAARALEARGIICGEIGEDMVGQTVVVAGLVKSLRQSFTRERRPFVNAVLEGLGGSVSVIAWPDAYERTKELWADGAIVIVRGRVRARNGELTLICDHAMSYDAAAMPEPEDEPEPESPPRRVHIVLMERGDDEDVVVLQRLFETIDAFPGHNPIRLTVETAEGAVQLKPPRPAVAYCPELHSQLASLVGEAAIRVETV